MNKNLIKIAGFGAGLAVIMALLSLFFDGERWADKGYVADRDVRIASIAAEEPGSIDVLNVGDSVCNISLTPVELFRDYGYTSYNIGRDLQKPVETFFYIRTALEEQQPKVILWEAHNLFREENIFDFGSMVLAEFLKYEIPFVKYHYIWKYWLEGPGIRKYYKGYLINEAVKPYTGGDYYYFADEEIYPIFPRAYGECGVDYIDANYDIDKLQIDWSRDTFDGGDHLNLFGARKMTRYLGDYLRAECGLTDHREDPSYQSWHDIQDEYEETVREMEGTSYIILENELKKKP